MTTAIVWFRRDLRLADNPALTAALAAADAVVPVYVHSPEEDGAWAPGGATRWWLHQSLGSLDASLRERGARLVILRGPVRETLLDLVRATGATSIHWNRQYEPAAIQRDTRLKAEFREAGVAVESTNASLLFEPWTIRNGSGDPYRVFTPFWRTCQQQLASVPPPTAAPSRVPLAPGAPAGVVRESLELLPQVRWDDGFHAQWTPGEAGALARVEAFCDEWLAGYGDGRNRPDLPATSRLSPHLHFGELSPRQAVAVATRASSTSRSPGLSAGAEAFLRELGWREFAHHLLYHFPQTTDAPMDRRFERLDWRHDPEALRAWQRGRTGYPIVDAGMRELWATGWMHNRVRMIVASFLTKNLGIHWAEGLRWFHDTLVDADLANNVLGWQWTAGCGADAAPYYRIFNPILQTERFDPERAYVRRWVPELAQLPDAVIHRPWEASAAVLAAAGVRLGQTYPEPMVDFRGSRERALAQWAKLKGDANPDEAPARKSSTKGTGRPQRAGGAGAIAPEQAARGCPVRRLRAPRCVQVMHHAAEGRGRPSNERAREMTAETLPPALLRRFARTLARWFDAGATPAATSSAEGGAVDRVDWLRIIPFLGMHLACLAVIWVGWSPVAVGVAIGLYVIRMFAITGFYHRYFSHRAFKTTRAAQFLFGVLGASAVQRGPIWWAAHHRHHHAHSDQPEDVHSPVQRGFLWSHMGWFLSQRYFAPDLKRVRDLLQFPELRLLDRFDILVPVALAVAVFGLGWGLETWAPHLGADRWQLLVWGFFVSTVACYHATYTINSLSHVFGRRRYETRDESRNNLWLALLTFGEGWHNNHHHYPMSARQGFYWWEIDLTYYGLRVLAAFGLVWDLKPVPDAVRDGARRASGGTSRRIG